MSLYLELPTYLHVNFIPAVREGSQINRFAVLPSRYALLNCPIRGPLCLSLFLTSQISSPERPSLSLFDFSNQLAPVPYILHSTSQLFNS